MLFDSQYTSIALSCQAEYTQKGSRFMAFAYPVSHENDAKQHLVNLKLEYPDATHHCYVWILNPDKSSQRLNDDGEPSNTAARPILRQINALQLTNILLVVIRYFGGKKLGISGLIEAYGMAAKLCLANCECITKTRMDYYKIEVDFEHEHLIYNSIRKLKGSIIEISHSQNAIITLSINHSSTETFITDCKKMGIFDINFLKTDS